VTTARSAHKFLPIPNFALDKHTARDKEMGKNIDDFFIEGYKLENEAFPNPFMKKARELLKKRKS
jgi:hypothetical protein